MNDECLPAAPMLRSSEGWMNDEIYVAPIFRGFFYDTGYTIEVFNLFNPFRVVGKWYFVYIVVESLRD